MSKNRPSRYIKAMTEQLDYAGNTIPAEEALTRKRAAALARIAGIAALALGGLRLFWMMMGAGFSLNYLQLLYLAHIAIMLSFGIVTIVANKHLRQRNKSWTYAVRWLALGTFLFTAWNLLRDILALSQDGWGVFLTYPQLIPIELLICAVALLAGATYVAMFRLPRTN
jgi:hypothetical protein